MAMEQARAYLKQYHKEQDILVLDASSATVEQAAQACSIAKIGRAHV